MAAFLDGPKKASLEIIEKAVEKALVEDEADHDTDYEGEDQVFEDYESLHARLNRTLYYDQKSSSSSTDRLSFGVTQLSVEAFNHLGLESCNIQLDRLDVCRAAQVTKGTAANPTSLVLALMYLERLRSSNPSYLTSISSTDLFLVSLMVASKYLHDDGEEDEVFNEEWAKSGGLERKELNRLEMEFLTSIDWRLHRTPREFEDMVKRLEMAVVKRQVDSRNWKNVTYCDLMVLSRDVGSQTIWDALVTLTLKVVAVSVAAYAASLVTMMGTCHVLNQVKLGPSAVTESVNTIYSSLEVSRGEAAENSTDIAEAGFYVDVDAVAYVSEKVNQAVVQATNRSLVMRPSTCSRGGGRRNTSGLLYFNFRPPGRVWSHQDRRMKLDGPGWMTTTTTQLAAGKA